MSGTNTRKRRNADSYKCDLAEHEENNVKNKERKLCSSKKADPILGTPPVRKSERLRKTSGFYYDVESEDSPISNASPAKVKSKTRPASSKSRKIKSTTESGETVEETLDKSDITEESINMSAKLIKKETVVPERRSTRTIKQPERLVDKIVGKAKESPATTVATSKTSVTDSVNTSETPRSSRKAVAVMRSKGTPVSSKTTPYTSRKDTAEIKSNEVLVGKKLEWKFNIYGIPKCPLPCRETQFEEIWKFLFENVNEKNSGCMYVSGVPGTGKTVIVQAVVDTMLKLNDKETKNLQFKNLYINGLTLASPDKIWKRMFKMLDLPSKSKGISTKEALKRLDSYFESHQRSPIVLVVDELDQILDKQQSILYQLLEWSSHSKNMFSFVAIFNTMSLPEHGLAMRNYSRMGFKRAVFPPYSFDQLQTIVLNMLSTFTTLKLSTESVTLLSRKVAAISGDARRALEIARRALEIAESGNLSGIQAVSNAFKEIFSSAKIETIKYTSLLEQLVLKTVCDEVRCSGVDEVLIARIYEHVIPKAVYEGMQWPKDEILKALMRLAMMRLIIIEDDIPSLHKRVLLKVPVEDVNYALGLHTDLEN